MAKVNVTRASVIRTGDQQSLVDRIHRGDAAAEGELLELFHGRLLVMLTVRTRDRDAARELAQEAMIAALAALRQGRLREPDKLAGFVHGIARNLANNHLRLRARDRDRHRDLVDDVAIVMPPDSVEMRERIALARSAMRRLSFVDRRILALTYVSGWKPRAIARALGLSPSVVRTRKSRALQKVQEFVTAVTRSGRKVPPRS